MLFHPLADQEAGSDLEDILRALLDCRDFLGYQLGHANGCMDEEEFERVAEPYLREVPVDQARACRVVHLLRFLVPDRLDADVLSVVLRCSHDQAAKALADNPAPTPPSEAESRWERVRVIEHGGGHKTYVYRDKLAPPTLWGRTVGAVLRKLGRR